MRKILSVETCFKCISGARTPPPRPPSPPPHTHRGARTHEHTVQSLIYTQLETGSNRGLRRTKTTAQNRKCGYSFGKRNLTEIIQRVFLRLAGVQLDKYSIRIKKKEDRQADVSLPVSCIPQTLRCWWLHLL